MRYFCLTCSSNLFAVPLWSYNLHVWVQKCAVSSPTAVWNYSGQCRGPGTRHTAAKCDRGCFVNVQTFKVRTGRYLWGQSQKETFWRTYLFPSEHHKNILGGFIISERFRQFYFFTKRSNLLLEKSRKIKLSAFIFHRTKCKIVTFFVNASRLGEKLKKGTFLEKKGGYFKLSGENILTSILSAFHPFLTLPNKTLKREKGTFFSVWSDFFKSAKKVPFCGLGTFLSKEQKRYLFCGWKRCSHKCEKGTLKNKWVKLYLKAVSNPTDWQMSTVWRHLFCLNWLTH